MDKSPSGPASQLDFKSIRDKYIASPIPQYTIGGLTLAAGLTGSGRRGYPSPVLAGAYCFAYSYGGYLYVFNSTASAHNRIQSGDKANGTLAVTAWSLAYTASYAFKSLTSFRPTPVALLAMSATNLVMHGSGIFI